MQLPGRNAPLRHHMLQLLDQLVEIGALAGVLLHALTLQDGKVRKPFLHATVIAALQQLLEQTAERTGFEALQSLALRSAWIEERGRTKVAEQRLATRIDQQIMCVEVAVQDA